MLKSALATLRFLTELALLAGVAWLGALLGHGGWPSVVLAILAVGIVVVLWGRLIAPRANRRLSDPARLIVEIVLFAGTAAGLAALGHPIVALVGGVVAIAGAAVARPLDI